MTPENFCYWLQGFFEVSNEKLTLNEKQIEIIKDHLKLVFDKQTPNREQTLKSFMDQHHHVTSIC